MNWVANPVCTRSRIKSPTLLNERELVLPWGGVSVTNQDESFRNRMEPVATRGKPYYINRSLPVWLPLDINQTNLVLLGTY